MTSPNIRGYGIYSRMGYIDLSPFYLATRRLPSHRPTPEGLRLRKATRRDLPLIQSAYNRSVEGMMGWAARNPGALAATSHLYPEVLGQFRIVLWRGEVAGYTRAPKGNEAMAEELVVSKDRPHKSVLQTLEAGWKSEYAIVRGVTDMGERRRLKAAGYDLHHPTIFTDMALHLRRRIRQRDLRILFGLAQGRFVHYRTDWF